MTTLYPEREHFVHLSTLVNDPAHWRALSEDENPWEQTVAEFTGALHQLYGVPFNYLVPDNRMLPPESIRFFYVDLNWLDAMRDGALSLGRIGAMDFQHDQAMTPIVARRADQVALNARRARLGRDAVPEQLLPPIYGGFLIRSAVVAGWPGLEVKAFKASQGTGVNTKCTGASVDLIRMSRLSNDVMLCLFAERFGCINIHEPKEGINFGARPEFPGGAANAELAPARYEKQLRGLGVGGYKVGEFIQGAVVEVPLRSSTTRVVEVKQLQQAIVKNLQGLNPPAWAEKPFTSAQFALQMVEGASQHIFRATDVPPPVVAAARIASVDQRQRDQQRLNDFLFGPEQEGTR